MKTFSAKIELIGINPFVFVPEDILAYVFKKAKKDKGPIRIKGTINNKPYKQTLMKYVGDWRLYINTTMLKDSPKRIGETIEVGIDYDPEERAIEMHGKLKTALEEHEGAKRAFDSLSPSRRHEIVRYISNLKSEESINKNVEKAIDFLTGKGRFVGREKP
jgi:uncharacterized protein YdeI (YjbR/CyaY-like superfamily)